MIIGTDMYSAPALVSHIQSWVATGSASITVLSTRLHLDKSCNASLDTLAEPDCFQAVEAVKTTTLQAVTTVTKATVKTIIPTPEEEGPSVKDSSCKASQSRRYFCISFWSHHHVPTCCARHI